jgi:flagellar hook-length control protein FliK
MQINPLFINTAEVTTPNGETKNFRLDNCSYLFSDIIKVEMDENSETTVDENNVLAENPLVLTAENDSKDSITQSANFLFEDENQIISEKVDLVDDVTVTEVVTNFVETSTPSSSTKIVGTPLSLSKNEKESLENLFNQIETIVKENLTAAEKTTASKVVSDIHIESENKEVNDQVVVPDLLNILKPLIEEIKSNLQNYPTVEKISLVTKDKEINVSEVQENLLGSLLEEMLLNNEKVSLVFTTVGGTVALEISEDSLAESVTGTAAAKEISSPLGDENQNTEKEILQGEKPSTTGNEKTSVQSEKLDSSKIESSSVKNFPVLGLDQKVTYNAKIVNTPSSSYLPNQNNVNAINSDETDSTVKLKNIKPTAVMDDSQKISNEDLHIKTSSSVKASGISVTGNIDVIKENGQSEKIANGETSLKNSEEQLKPEPKVLVTQSTDNSKVTAEVKVETSVSKDQIKSETTSSSTAKINVKASINELEHLTIKNENEISQNSNTKTDKTDLNTKTPDVLKIQTEQSGEKETVSTKSEPANQIFNKTEFQHVENKTAAEPIVKSEVSDPNQNRFDVLKNQVQQSSEKEVVSTQSESDKPLLSKLETQSVGTKITAEPIAKSNVTDLNQNSEVASKGLTQQSNVKETGSTQSESTKQIFTNSEPQPVENKTTSEPSLKSEVNDLNQNRFDASKNQVQQSSEKEVVSTQSEADKTLLSKLENQLVDTKITAEPRAKSNVTDINQNRSESSKNQVQQTSEKISVDQEINSEKQTFVKSEGESIQYKATEAASENINNRVIANQIVFKVTVKNSEAANNVDKSSDSEVLLKKNNISQDKPILNSSNNIGQEEVVSAKIIVDDNSKLNNQKLPAKETTPESFKTYQIKLVENIKTEPTEVISKPETLTESLPITNGKQNILTKSQVLKMFSSPFIQFENPVKYQSINHSEFNENQLPLEMISMKQTLDFKVGQEVGLFTKPVTQIPTSPITNDFTNISPKEKLVMEKADTKINSVKQTAESVEQKPISVSEPKVKTSNFTTNNVNVKSQKIITELNELKESIKTLEGKTDFVKVEKPIVQKETVTEPDRKQTVVEKLSVNEKKEDSNTFRNSPKISKDVIEETSIKLSGEKVNSTAGQQDSVQKEESVNNNQNKEVKTNSSSKVKTVAEENTKNVSEIVKEVVKSAPDKDYVPKNILVNEKESVLPKENKVELAQEKSASTTITASDNSGKNETKNEQEKKSNSETARTESETKPVKETQEFKPIVEMKERGISETVKMSNNFKTVRTTEIVKEIQNIIQSGEKHSVTMKLTPAAFGSVKVLLETVNNVLSAKIEVENDTVKQIVQSNIEQLKQALNENGIQLSTINISLSNHDQRSPRSQFMKKKGNASENDKKVDVETGNEIKPKKQYGYNTYEYLV